MDNYDFKSPRKTKIVATLGPASNNVKTIRSLVDSGVNVFRLNFSHGQHADHQRSVEMIRDVEQRCAFNLAILADLQGPKFRLGQLKSGQVAFEKDAEIRFVLGDTVDNFDVPIPHKSVFESIEVGQNILIDDGRIAFSVTNIDIDCFRAVAQNAGVITNRKGISFPDTLLKIEPITRKDEADLELALELGVDWVAMSFVQRAEDITALRCKLGERASIIAKIEKPLAVKNISDIVDAADAVMVARGDLGVECSWVELPSLQTRIVEVCREQGKPVIVATQMLESMIESPIPTRAEAADVAHAVNQGVDAVMLSGESAVGKFPVEAVEAMRDIAVAAEASMPANRFDLVGSISEKEADSLSIAHAANLLANSRNACCIASFTESGATAQRVSRFRGNVPIMAVCHHEDTARRLALMWGVYSTVCEDAAQFDAFRSGTVPLNFANLMVQKDRAIVVTSGSKFGAKNGTDTLKIAYLKS